MKYVPFIRQKVAYRQKWKMPITRSSFISGCLFFGLEIYDKSMSLHCMFFRVQRTSANCLAATFFFFVPLIYALSRS